jgi:protein-L-isoaspartate(D-aspartate) O-methyltransferase
MRFSHAWIFIGLLLLIRPVYGQESDAVKGVHAAFSERIKEREEMVDQHIANYPYQPVKDKQVLDAMKRVPRHVFVPEDFRGDAYRNSPMRIGYNQTISQPFIVAHMTELLELEAHHKVLEIGTGSGYQAAVLGELCDQVYTIEIVRPLGLKAKALLKDLGYEQIQVRIGDGYEGWPEEAPFDRIIVTCAPDQIPQPIVDQLAPGGRIVIPVGKQNASQYMVTVFKNKKGNITSETHYPVRFVPMTGKVQN